jgi:acetylornithine deacetylase/succinyl-diaminopimelate desuccinylase-like protein
MFNRELFLETQTSRCLLCENAPCSHACTSHLPVSDIIRSFRFENHMGAAEKVGNVSCMDCSNPVCMSACRRSKLDSAVEIPKVIAQVVSIIENMPKEVAKCKVNYEVAWTRDTVYYDKTLVGYVQEAVDELGNSNQRINSGAGHDAQFASYMLPTTMVFVPSKDGHSHCEPEFTSTKQCTMGASVLLNAVLKCDKED